MRLIKLFAGLLVIGAIACHRTRMPQRLVFYHRGEAYHDSAIYYYDYLAINNYSDSPKTAKELYLMARHYVDTVQAEHVVRAVTFLARDASKPRGDWNSEIEDRERETALLTFYFSYPSSKDSAGPGPLIIISNWTGRTHYMYYKRMTKFTGNLKPGFDSVLASPEPLRKP